MPYLKWSLNPYGGVSTSVASGRLYTFRVEVVLHGNAVGFAMALGEGVDPDARDKQLKDLALRLKIV